MKTLRSPKEVIPYSHQYIDASDIAEVIGVLKSAWITQGPKIKEFESALCKYTGAKYAVAVSSGTAALHIAVFAAGIEKGDEVITSPLTFAASANCILYCGGKPIFADIKTPTANIDPAEIVRRINKKTKAVIPVHFAGRPAELEEIRNIAKRHNLIVIEDAAHALGAEYRGSKIGSCKHSDMAVFSFHPVKSITTGEGGAILTNSKKLYERLSILRNHGITKDGSRFARRDPRKTGRWYYEQQYLGFNYRITDIQSALGVSQLKKLDGFLKRRGDIARIYDKALSAVSQVELPAREKHVKSAWHLYPIRIKRAINRKKVFDALRAKGIGAQIHYIPVYTHPHYQRLGYNKGLCPKAEAFYEREISIPLYPAMKREDIKYVIDVLIKAVKQYA